MNSFIGWIGGKRLLRKKIISEFPKQEMSKYVEVFGGAGWVLFEKEQTSKQIEVFNDIDGNLINLFRCMKYHRSEVEKELELILPSRETFCDFREQINIPGLTDIQRAARYFYLIKTSFGCDRRSYATTPKRIDKTIDRLFEIQQRLVNVNIEHKDFEALIKLYDSENTLFYLDPPYHGTERHYDNIFTQAAHQKLNNCLKNIKGKFILSYNDDEFIRNLYSDFHITPVSRNSTLSAKGDNRQQFRELIIKNYN